MIFEDDDKLTYGEYPMPSEADFDSGNMTTLYRVAFRNQLDSIFTYGYDREFTASKGGNLYGPGVYCTNRLDDSINNVKTKPEYGDCIVKMFLIGGYDKFIVLSKDIATQQYGKGWRIEDQVRYIIKNKREQDSVIDAISFYCRRTNENPYHGRTAGLAYTITSNFMGLLKRNGVRGIVYKGNRDGHCSLPYDFSAVIPYSVSFDQGRTFKKRFNKATYDRLLNSIDSEFRYGNKYDKVFKPIKGFALVVKSGKFNYVACNFGDVEISPVWFDYCTLLNPESGEFDITYDGIKYHACVDGVLTDDGDEWFEFQDLPQQTAIIKRNIEQRNRNRKQP